MSFRIEEKIALTNYESTLWHSVLTRRGMEQLYPARTIRSVYFETRDMLMFTHSEEGVLPRKKIRLRHYPEQSDGGHALEIKVSSIEGRFKTSTRLNTDDARLLLRDGYLDQQYGLVMPKLQISYRRSYFMLDGLRITFDNEITYGVPGQPDRLHENWTVCELKAPVNAPPDWILQIAEVPRRRFSKYSLGILALSRGNAF